MNTKATNAFGTKNFAFATFFLTGLTGLATFLIVATLGVILLNVLINGWSGLSLRFIMGGTEKDMFDVNHAGVLPMIIGTAARVIIMTIFVIPVGVITAVYLTEYAHPTSMVTRVTRGAVNNLAGVPSIVFGLFGLGFFINFLGQNLDDRVVPVEDQAITSFSVYWTLLKAALTGRAPFFVLPHQTALPLWGRPAILWASLTLAVMTLPVVIIATEESLRAIPQGMREASLALGATKLETIIRIVLPQALPGILTGGILAVSRAAGEVAPILFTGAAYFMADLPRSLHDQFMDLGYHVFILSTQSPNIDKTKPILYATVVVLLFLTFALNIVAILIRARMRKKLRAL